MKAQEVVGEAAALDEAAVLQLFVEAGALQEGHFRLSSGRHADRYLQSALVLQWPSVARALGGAIAAQWPGIDVVVSPALGGLLIGHEVAAAAGVRMVFAERVNGSMQVRRGLRVAPGERALVVEDVVTTGGSALEVARLLEEAQASVVGIGALVDRRPETVQLPLPFRALLRLAVPSWPEQECPGCRSGSDLDTPGSRRTTH